MLFLILGIYVLALAGASYYIKFAWESWGTVLPFALLIATLLAIGMLVAHRATREKVGGFIDGHHTRIYHVSLLMLGLMWCVPFVLPPTRFFARTFSGEIISLLLGLGALTLLPLAARKLVLPRVALVPFALCGLIALQMALGKIAYLQEGLQGQLLFLWAGALVVLGAMVRRELGLERTATTLAWFTVAGTLISTVIACLHQFGVNGVTLGGYTLVMPRPTERAWANTGQPNHLANYLTLGLISVGFLFAAGRLHLRWAVPLLFGLVYVLRLTGSRAVWLYLAGIAVVSLIFWWRERSQANRRLLGVAVAALVVFAVLPHLLALFSPDPSVSADVPSRMNVEALAADPRTRLWRVAWLLFTQQPVLGVGFGGFGWHFLQLAGELQNSRVGGVVLNAHNLVLHVMVEFGLIGAAIVVCYIALWFVGLSRVPRTPVCWWVWTLAWVLGAHSMLEYPLWHAHFLGMAAVLLGLAEAHQLRLSFENRLRATQTILVAALGAGWLLMAQLNRDARWLGYFERSYASIFGVTEINNNMKARIHRTSLLWSSVEFRLASTMNVDASDIDQKLGLNSRVARRHPTADVIFRQAILLALDGQAAASRRQWDNAAGAYPEQLEAAVRMLERNAVEGGRRALLPLLDHARGIKKYQ